MSAADHRAAALLLNEQAEQMQTPATAQELTELAAWHSAEAERVELNAVDFGRAAA